MSIVDFLKSQGQDSSFQARTKLAGDFGVTNYTGTAEQNISLLDQMKTKAPAPTVAPATDLNKQMESFSAGKQLNQFGEEIKAPTQERVEDFNKKFPTTPPPAGVVPPVDEKKIVTPPAPIVTPEPPKIPEVKVAEYKPVVSHEEWIQRGKKPTELVDLVETKYGIQAEYDAKTNTVVGYDEAGNKTKVWSFDEAGNSIREDIPVYTGEQFFTDFNGLLESGDKKQINSFLTKNKELYDQNKEALTGIVRTFQKQQEVNKTVARLSSLDGKGLYNASLEGDFTQGDDVFNGLSPEKQQEFISYQKRYVRQDAKNLDKKIVADLKSDDAEEVYNKMAIHNPTYQEKYNEIVFENTERSDLQSSLTTQYEEIEQKRLTLSKLKAKIDKDHPSASETYKRSLLNRESGELVDEIEQLTVGYNTNLSQYNMVNADAQAEYQAYTLDAGIEFDTYQKAIGITVDRYKTDQAQMNQTEILKMQYEQADLTLKKNQEFTMKVKSFDADIRDKTGSYQTNDKGELLYVVKGVATKVLESNGNVVATEKFQNYQESLQKNEYGGYDIIRTYNDGTRPDVSSYDMQGNLVGGTSSVVAGAINGVGAEKDLQCGEAVNTYLQKLGGDRIFGDSYESKTDKINSDVPMMGGVAIWDPLQSPDGTFSEYGHVGIITGISPDGKTLEITDWNYSGDEKKQVHKVERSVIENSGGYHIPTSTKEDLAVTGVEGNAKHWVDAWNKGTLDLETILTKIGSSKEGQKTKDAVMKYVSEQGGVAYRSEDDPAVLSVKGLEDTIGNILSSNYLHTVSGTVQTSPMNWLTGGKSDVLADLKFLIEGQTLQELIDAKGNGATFGALSNEELKMLQASSSKIAANVVRNDDNQIIGFNMSEEKFVEELESMKALFGDKIDRMTGVDKKDANLKKIDTIKNITY